MNKICIIAKNKNTYFINRLIEEVGEGVAVFDPWSDFELPEAQKYIVRSTGVYHSDLDLLIVKSLPQDKVINPHSVLARFRSKPSQYEWFEEENFPSLPWLSLKGADLINVERFFRLYPEVVVKPFIGQGGWGVEALKWEGFKSWWKRKKGVDENYLMQPLIKDAREFRYFFVQGGEPLVLERKSKSGIAANFQRQGEAFLTNLPSPFSSFIEGLVHKSGAKYGAVDLLLYDDRPYLLELNSVPGVEQLEKVSGQNVIKTLSSLLR